MDITVFAQKSPAHVSYWVKFWKLVLKNIFSVQDFFLLSYILEEI